MIQRFSDRVPESKYTRRATSVSDMTKYIPRVQPIEYFTPFVMIRPLSFLDKKG